MYIRSNTQLIVDQDYKMYIIILDKFTIEQQSLTQAEN